MDPTTGTQHTPARREAIRAALAARSHARRTGAPADEVFPLTKTSGGGDPLISTLFARRGWTDEWIAEFNDPSYPPLRDMDEMVAALKQVRDSADLIVVMPDYDMDGITAGTLGWAGLSELGFNVELYVPDYRDGHDIRPEAVDKLVAAFPTVKTVITCDAGINSHAGIQRGKDLGLTMLVTDHHTQEPGAVVPADVAVNPCRTDDDYPNKHICGAFVFWQVLDAFARTHVRHKVRAIALLRLFAGIGTVSDVMPLAYENRQVVRDSIAIARMLYVPIPAADTVTHYDPEQSLLMQVLRAEGHHEAYLRAFAGFAVVLKAFREHGKLEQDVDEDKRPIFDDQGDPVMVRRRGPLREVADISEEFYGYYLAPTFNAVRRIEASMHDAFGVFTADDLDTKYAHAVELIEGNFRRRDLVKDLHQQIQDSYTDGLQPLAPWVWTTAAPSGMLGLLASELSKHYDHAVAVVSIVDDPSKPRSGSMRAPGWYDIIATLRHGNGHDAQGHEQACGIHLPNASELIRLAEDLERTTQEIRALKAANGELGPSQPDLVIGDHPEADADFYRHDDLVELGLTVEALGPFGHGFPPPQIDIVLDLSRCRLDTTDSGIHLKITTHSGVKAYWWNKADALLDLKYLAGQTVTMRAHLRVGEYMGHLFPQFVIQEWHRPAQPQGAL